MAGAPGAQAATLPPAIVIHDLEHARAALAAARALDRPVTLLSGPAAAAIGPSFFAALLRVARAEYPSVRSYGLLDCGHAAGRAMAALHHGLDGVIYTGSHNMLMKLADIAEDQHATILDHRPRAFDPLDNPDPETAIRAWLTSR